MIRVLGLLSPLLLIGAANASDAPRYDAAGDLIVPTDYRDWIFLTSGLNMNYGDEPIAEHDTFDNVFVSWRAFKATGRWPQGTVFVKEGRRGATKGSINQTGQFQTEQRAYLELHVRDAKRFPTGWGFFEVAGGKSAKVLPSTASCYACHQQNAAVETTFVQFYPTAKPIAIKADTFDASK